MQDYVRRLLEPAARKNNWVHHEAPCDRVELGTVRHEALACAMRGPLLNSAELLNSSSGTRSVDHLPRPAGAGSTVAATPMGPMTAGGC